MSPPRPGTPADVPMDFETALSVDAVEEAARELAGEGPARQDLEALCQGDPAIDIRGLRAGYGRMEILHGIDLVAGRGQSLCLIGPNGAGKSTVLHSAFGFADVMAGSIHVGGQGRHAPRLQPPPRRRRRRLRAAGQLRLPRHDGGGEPAYGGLPARPAAAAKQAAERVFDRYERLARRRHRRAGVLSGGERRLLEISRALIMEPEVLLVDEPSIGLEPRFINMVFEILADLQHRDGKTIVMVEQNAKKGLEFADIGYVLVSGRLAMAGPGDALLEDPEVGRLFLGA